MSRTFRWIPYWCRKPSNWDKTQYGIYQSQEWRLVWPIRCEIYNGYDAHKGRSCVYGTDAWKEVYSGASRKYAKRFWNKRKRRKSKALVIEELEMLNGAED